jgi:opacity protein-like surface antigen
LLDISAGGLMMIAWRMGILASAFLLMSAAAPVSAATTTDLGLLFAAGFREDRLDWSIATFLPHEGEILPARSELSWDNLRIWQLRTRGTLTLTVEDFSHFAVRARGDAGYGRIHSGANRDSDFVLFDNAVIEFSRSDNRADRGHVLDLSLAVGPYFTFNRNGFAVTPLLGYSHHEQNLRIRDGFQTIPMAGPFAGLDSSYDAKWRGPWTGVEVEFQPLARLSLYGSLHYHWADFEAEADWNLRDDFQHPVSFTHSANGSGIKFSATAAYQFAKRWSLDLIYDYSRWQTSPGIHRFFFVDTGAAAVRLNEVDWRSQALLIGLNYRF